ncbi:MAG: HEAT repeat domain-containing protein [Planctomycetes bacterium]|nr:HEAT repeat domain-containing protein [Planctomycetota bacterium]
MVQESKILILLLLAALILALPGVGIAGADSAANKDIIDMVIEALRGNDPQLQSAVIAIVRDMPGPEVTKALVQELPKLPAAGQVQLLSALGDRTDATALPVVLEATKSQDESVRVAALRAVGQLGNASNISALAEHAAASRGAEQKAAREGLYRLRGPDVDAAILKGLAAASAPVKAELIGAIGERNIAGAVEMLLQAGKDENRRVRLESYRVLRIVARPEDMPALVNLLLETRNEADRGEVEKLVAAVAHKITDPQRQSAAVQAVLPNIKESADRASLLRVLGRIGNGSSLPILRAALSSREAEVQDAAIRALSDWPTAEPVPDLIKVAQTSESQVHKVLALRGFVRLLGLESDRPAEQTIDLYKKAMDLAGDVTEKRRVLAGLAGVKSPAALSVVAGYLDDVALHLEAESAAVRIGQALVATQPQQVKDVLQKVLAGTKNDTIRTQAQEIIQQIKP